MAAFYYTTPEGARYRITLLPLSAYEADGGRYDDSGNGGEACEKSEFLAALIVQEKDGDDWAPAEDLLAVERDLGIPSGALWHDSVLGWHLLREWPEEAPLDARMVGE